MAKQSPFSSLYSKLSKATCWVIIVIFLQLIATPYRVPAVNELSHESYTPLTVKLISAAPRVGGKDSAWLLGQGVEACAELGIAVAISQGDDNSRNCDCCTSDSAEQIAVFRTATPTTVIVQWVMRHYDVSHAALRWWTSDAMKVDLTVRKVTASILYPSKWYAADNWLLRRVCGFCGGADGYQGFIYKAVVEGLPLNKAVTYYVGASSQRPAVHQLTLRDAATASNKASHTVVVADIGVRGGQHTWAAVSEVVQTRAIDQVLAVGDISYHNGYAKVYDEFFRLMQAMHIFPSVPVMTAPGNHENAYEFAAYLDRFPQPLPTIPAPRDRPGQGFYDLKNGNVHWISLNFESKGAGLEPNMIPIEDAMPLTAAEFEWLEATLRAIQKGRKAGEWVVVFAHRYVGRLCAAQHFACKYHGFRIM